MICGSMWGVIAFMTQSRIYRWGCKSVGKLLLNKLCGSLAVSGEFYPCHMVWWWPPRNLSAVRQKRESAASTVPSRTRPSTERYLYCAGCCWGILGGTDAILFADGEEKNGNGCISNYSTGVAAFRLIERFNSESTARQRRIMTQ